VTLAVAALAAVAVGLPNAPAATLARVANPSAGQVEAIAVEVKGRFAHKRPPRSIALSLPAAGQPAGVEILAEDRRTKLVGHRARYLLLIEILDPSSTSASTVPPGSAINWSASLIAGFRAHFRKHGAAKFVVTKNVFGASRRSLAAFERRIRSLAGEATISALDRPALIDASGLGVGTGQLSELGTLWKDVWGFLRERRHTAAGLEQLYAPFEADFPGMFSAPPQSASTTPTAPNKPAPRSTAPRPQLYGSTLTGDPTAVALGNVDFALWQVGQPIPVSGQVTSISVRGNYAGGSCGTICQTNLHFQDLRPTAGGQLQVIATSSPFTLPSTLGTYSFALSAFKFRVQAGDYVALATSGGSWNVLAPAAGEEVAQFTGYLADMNGDVFSSNLMLPGDQINMQVTVQPNA
jgi:hypothetical protein